jgi:hypothetical protein
VRNDLSCKFSRGYEIEADGSQSRAICGSKGPERPPPDKDTWAELRHGTVSAVK